MDLATSRALHLQLHFTRAEPGGVITDFSKKKKRTSNQEGGPRVLGSRLLIIHPLPNVTDSAADRSTFFLLNGVVGDGPRAHSISISGRAGRDDHRFFKKKGGLRIKKAAFRCIGAGFWSFTPC